jgi:4-hydroxy-tetrahydrodipicolinate reductase
VPTLLLVGYGRMGRLVEELGRREGFEIVGRLDSTNNAGGAGITAERCRGVDVAVDFSTAAAVVDNLPRLAAHGVNMVIGTTGWSAHEAALRRLVEEAGVGVVVAPNFSPGALVFQALVEYAAALFAERPEVGAWVHELHHAAKRDAPSGTALALEAAMRRRGYGRSIAISSTRAGAIPGTHEVGFDGPYETVTLTHVVRDRATFAYGALWAAKWIIGRRGWFTMRDVLGLDGPAGAVAAAGHSP